LKSYFGNMSVGEIGNTAAPAFDGWLPMKENNVSFVHYTDCQQLIIWLPQPGREYGMVRLWNQKTGRLMEEWPVADKLNGSIQILWDTLPIPPGAYRIEISWQNTVVHSIGIVKHKKGTPTKPRQAPISTPAIETREPIVYKDGFGNTIPNEDLLLREKLMKDIADKFGRRIEYEGNFRAGTIIYSDVSSRIVFYHEMGGGNCMFYIDVPTEEYWEAQTKTPLRLRKEILEYVATRVQAEQATNCRYEIGSDTITYYYK
jgi:hypothetical protein